MRTLVSGIVIPLLLVAGFLGGIIGLGAAATEDLQRHRRGDLSFSNVQCNAPTPLAHAEFLREVQYEAGVADRLDVFRDGWQDRLRDAFVRSAWVEDVTNVRLTSPGLVRVQLRFRQPVLAVTTAEGLRAVDCHQVLLPRAMPVDGLPLLHLADTLPAVPSGSVLSDPAVASAIQTLVALSPDLRADLATIEVSGTDVILRTTTGTRIVRSRVPEKLPLLVRGGR